MKGCVLMVLILVPTAFSAMTPNPQSLVVPLPYSSQHASDISTQSEAMPGKPMTTATSNVSNSSRSDNPNDLSTPPVTCFKQNPITERLPIVLEDCYKMFVDILLAPTPLMEKIVVPGKDKYIRQNGNCIFSMKAIPRESIPTTFTEIELGTTFAKIVNQCVRPETEYFGGFQELVELSGWIVQVAAASRPR